MSKESEFGKVAARNAVLRMPTFEDLTRTVLDESHSWFRKAAKCHGLDGQVHEAILYRAVHDASNLELIATCCETRARKWSDAELQEWVAAHSDDEIIDIAHAKLRQVRVRGDLDTLVRLKDLESQNLDYFSCERLYALTLPTVVAALAYNELRWRLSTGVLRGTPLPDTDFVPAWAYSLSKNREVDLCP